MTDTTHLEEKIAHLTRMVEDLSDVVARQEKELSLATRRISTLMERASEQELDTGGTVVLADQRPPHW
ncbi:MAG: SlyX family protein [Litoreibacter sp.]